MWDRRELKARGKAALSANYWKSVLIALILFLIAGGGVATGSRSAMSITQEENPFQARVAYVQTPDGAEQDGAALLSLGARPSQPSRPPRGGPLGLVMALVMAFASAATSYGLLDLLILNPLEVGCRNFFIRNVETRGELGDISRAFTPAWIHNVVTMLLRDVFLVLWTMLFLVPGIVKIYSYRMTPYILADHPELSATEAITRSRVMMNGHKWQTFLLDLSFLGWYLLSIPTAGLLAVFYVNPYRENTYAALYRALRDETVSVPVLEAW